MSDLIVGMDLGTTNSAVGLVDSGFPILLANEEGQRVIPSAVWYALDGKIEVGHAALRARALEPERVVTSVKRLMGRRVNELGEDALHLVEQDAEGLPLILGQRPEEVSAEILKELKRIAEWRLEKRVRKAVLTVPAYFNDAQRQATIRAGELAGLEVVRIVNEPTAAALAYGLDQLNEHTRIAVYDLGGGTFDLSILELRHGVFQVIGTHGDTHLGGDDLDAAIAQKIIQRHGLPEPSAEQRSRLIQESERVKRQLSELPETSFRLPFYSGDQNIEMAISRTELEALAAGWIARTLRHCRQALADADLKAEDLETIILVGGSTRIPAVRNAVTELFGRAPNLSQHPDEAVALGAAMQAGILSGALAQMVLLDVTPLSLGIETFGGLMNVIIPRNSTIPCKAGELFTNAVDQQQAVQVRVLQGEREMARDNWELGSFKVAFEPAPKGQARVGVQFKIDENGVLEVLARDVRRNQDTVVQLGNAAVNVDDSAVERMVSESVDYAFDDMAERIFTEAKLKAAELLPAVEQVLAQGLALPEEREEIQAAMQEVREAIASEAANPLKSAVQRLDTATEALAARLVERAMDEALDRKLGLA